MQPIQDGTMWLSMVSSIRDLLSTSKTSSCCWTNLKCSNNFAALKCDTHYWECQGEKTTPSGQNRQSASSSAPAKLGNNPTAASNTPMVSHINPAIRVDGKLT